MSSLSDKIQQLDPTRIPRHVAIIGARDLDPAEIKKLKSKGVSVFSISDVHSFGIRKIMEDAFSVVTDSEKPVATIEFE